MRRYALIAMFLFAAGCEDKERLALTQHLELLQRRHANLSQRLQRRRTALNDAQTRLDTLSRDLTTSNAEIQAYLATHRLAADCIRTSRTSWSDPQHGVTPLQRLGTTLCSAALFSDVFKAEVDAVAAKLNDTERRTQKLDTEWKDLRREIEAHRKQIADDEAALQRVEAERLDVNIRLGIR